jgi:UDPglucose 6-dehydrogenase
VVAWDAAVTSEQLGESDRAISVCNDLTDALRGADGAILCTEWPEAVALDYSAAVSAMRGNLLVDGRYAWDPARAADAGLDLVRIGTSRPVRRATVPV